MNVQIYDEATQWLIRHRDGGLGDSDKPAFDRWLRTSPEHVRAYFEMSSVWEEVSDIGEQAPVAPEDLIARARQSAPDNVVPLAAPVSRTAPAVPHLTQSTRHTAVRRWAVAASFVVAILAAALLRLWNADTRTYTTEVGEQRSVILTDGSTVELNSRSRLKVKFTDTRRSVELMEGQAMFRVAQDRQRPFVVETDDTHVRAVGTQFDVYRKRIGVVVTVVEGRVAVRPGDMPKPAAGSVSPVENEQIFLSAGEQIVLTPQSPARATRVDVAAATAWTSRHLVFDAAPLAEVAEEFNRYNSRQLLVSDESLAGLNVSGVFSSSDPALLLKFLRAQPEVAVEETTHAIRILRR